MTRLDLGRKYHLLAGILIFTLLVGSLSARRSHAQPRPPSRRFHWIDGLDDLYPRQGGRHLSRPAVSRKAVDIPLPDPSFTVDFTHYPSSAEMAAFLDQLQSAYPTLVEVMEIGRSWQDRPILAVRIGDQATGDVDSRPALYVDGGLHGREAISSPAALYLVWYLASRYGSEPLITHLLNTRTVYAIPCVNPDGNDIFLDSDRRQRRTANPTASDDDGDGLFDEDGREGAGYGTYDVYQYEFDSQWVAEHGDDPFAEGWQAHLVDHTFVGIFDDQGGKVVQTDNDVDGLAGEDPPGGVDPNRNYDSHWELGEDDPKAETYRGPAAFSEPETGAVRDFVLGRPNVVTASSFQSGSDTLLHPWAWSAETDLPDRFWYEMLSRKGSQLTEVHGLQGARHTWMARGLYVAAGSEMDWLYEYGILAWTPEIYGASVLSFYQRITTTNTYTVGLSIAEAFNPPANEIPPTVARWLPWSLYILAVTPNVGLTAVNAGMDTLTLTIANDGLLPLDVETRVATTQGSYTSTASLSAAEQSCSVPFSPTPVAQAVTITLTATSRVGTAAGPVQVEVVRLEILDSTVRVIEGRVEPFVDLGAAFQGWFAGREWDSPEYHLGPPLATESFLPVVGRAH